MLKLKEDLIIPKGTEFDNSIIKAFYPNNPIQAHIGMSMDSVMTIVIDRDVISDRSDLFEEVV